jgi:hypothetical protein
MEHDPETCDECIVARENGDMDKQGYEEWELLWKIVKFV